MLWSYLNQLSDSVLVAGEEKGTSCGVGRGTSAIRGPPLCCGPTPGGYAIPCLVSFKSESRESRHGIGNMMSYLQRIWKFHAQPLV